jgi:hypothetical protein
MLLKRRCVFRLAPICPSLIMPHACDVTLTDMLRLFLAPSQRRPRARRRCQSGRRDGASRPKRLLRLPRTPQLPPTTAMEVAPHALTGHPRPPK